MGINSYLTGCATSSINAQDKKSTMELINSYEAIKSTLAIISGKRNIDSS